jgi:hypothetical protein
MIQSARYNPGQATIRVTYSSGVCSDVPAWTGIPETYEQDLLANWLAAGNSIVQPPSVTPTVSDVRAEAQRRIVIATGATDFASCVTKQLNATMRAVELTNKVAMGGTLTTAEAAESLALQQLADLIKAIRAASNAIEGAPPADYRDDAYWP